MAKNNNNDPPNFFEKKLGIKDNFVLGTAMMDGLSNLLTGKKKRKKSIKKVRKTLGPGAASHRPLIQSSPAFTSSNTTDNVPPIKKKIKNPKRLKTHTSGFGPSRIRMKELKEWSKQGYSPREWNDGKRT